MAAARAYKITMDAEAAEKEAAAAAAAAAMAPHPLERSESNPLPLRAGLGDDSTPASVIGALIFTCCGRGAHFHGGKEGMDSGALRSGLPGLPAFGMFANGESASREQSRR